MQLYTNEEQAKRLEAVGINSGKAHDIGTLMEALCDPSHGERVEIETRGLEKEYCIDYDNAGDAKFRDHDKSLIELLVRFAEWKTPRWRINEKYYAKERS